MDTLVPLLQLSMAIYIGAMLYFTIGLYRQAPAVTDQLPSVSVIIAARGSAEWLPRLFAQLLAQDYPAEKLQIVLADDGLLPEMRLEIANMALEDSSIMIVESRAGDPRLVNKNRALDAGIRASAGTVLLFTDADCQVGPKWVTSMASHFTAQVDFVIGWSQITAPNIKWGDDEPNLIRPLHVFEQVDFMMLMLAARSAARNGTPWASSGQNQAYRRTVFELVNGFEDLIGRLQGDDALFLQLARRNAAANVVFVDSPESRVKTEAIDSVGHLLRQRSRWAADGLAMLRYNPWFFPLPLATFIVNSIIVILAVLSISAPTFALAPLILALLTKAFVEGMLMTLGAPKMGMTDLRSHFPLWFIVQIPYVVIVGFGSFVGNRLGWKDRARAGSTVGDEDVASG